MVCQHRHTVCCSAARRKKKVVCYYGHLVVRSHNRQTNTFEIGNKCPKKYIHTNSPQICIGRNIYRPCKYFFIAGAFLFISNCIRDNSLDFIQVTKLKNTKSFKIKLLLCHFVSKIGKLGLEMLVAELLTREGKFPEI